MIEKNQKQQQQEQQQHQQQIGLVSDFFLVYSYF